MASPARTFRVSCRLSPIALAEWIENDFPRDHPPHAHIDAQAVRILERSPGSCSYVSMDSDRQTTTRRIRLSPTSWDEQGEVHLGKSNGTWTFRGSMRVEPADRGSTLTWVRSFEPLPPGTRGGPRLTGLAERAWNHVAPVMLESLALEAEVEYLGPTDTGVRQALAKRYPTRSRGFWETTASHFNPGRDFFRAALLLCVPATGILDLGLAFWLASVLHNLSGLVITVVAAAAILLGVVFLFVWLDDRIRTEVRRIDRVSTSADGLALFTRRRGEVQIPWSDVNLGGMRFDGVSITLSAFAPGLGGRCELNLTPPDAMAILSAPDAVRDAPPATVSARLGIVLDRQVSGSP